MEQTARVSRKFVGWHVTYTVILTAWGCLLARPTAQNELGPEPGYLILAIGALPSLILTVIGVLRRELAYRLAMLWAVVVTVGSLLLVATAFGFLWVVVAFPLFAFVVEGMVLYMSRNRVFSH